MRNRNKKFRLWSNDSYSGVIFNLLNHIGKTVELEGKVFVEESVKVINVKSYNILEKQNHNF